MSYMTNKKILIVDDDQDLLRGLSIRLNASGYRVCLAVDAISAISTARKEEPDLIILDIMLPGCDGFEVLEQCSRVSQAFDVLDDHVVFLIGAHYQHEAMSGELDSERAGSLGIVCTLHGGNQVFNFHPKCVAAIVSFEIATLSHRFT